MSNHQFYRPAASAREPKALAAGSRPLPRGGKGSQGYYPPVEDPSLLADVLLVAGRRADDARMHVDTDGNCLP